MKKMLSFALCLLLSFMVFGTSCGKKEASTKDEEKEKPFQFEDFVKNADPEFAKQVSEKLSEFSDSDVGMRSAGSEAEAEAADYIENELKTIGMKDVKIDKVTTDGWTFKGADLTFTSKGEKKTVVLGGYQTNFKAENEKLKIVYLKKGNLSSYKGVDVKGKLVLIEFSPDEDYWINYPAYQAQVKGARGIIAVSKMNDEIPDRIASNDSCSPAEAAALAISQEDADLIKNEIKKNGKKVGGTKQIEVVLNANSEVYENATTPNIYAEIKGKNDKEAIIFSAHYDGYYHSQYDDAFGVGTNIAIAKAFIESGIKPEKTLRFLFTGAEEWGKINAEADWATGAWKQITEAMPEWQTSTFALINIDSGYALNKTTSFYTGQPYEMRDYMSKINSEFLKTGYIEGNTEITVSDNIPYSWEEDFGYNALGIPTISNGSESEGEDEYFNSYYHSNKDLFSEGGYNLDTVKTMMNYYAFIAVDMSKLKVMPLNFEERILALGDTLETVNKSNAIVLDEDVQESYDFAKEQAKLLDEKIIEINNNKETTIDAVAFNIEIHKLYKKLNDDFLSLNWDFEAAFREDYLVKAYEYLDKAFDSFDDDKTLLSCLENIDWAYYATLFDKKTCDFFINRLKTQNKGTWAENYFKYEPIDGIDELMRSVMSSSDTSFAGEFSSDLERLRTLSSAKDQVKEQLSESIENDINGLNTFAENIKKII